MPLIHKSFAVDVRASEAEIQGDVREFLGVVPMVVGTANGGGAYIVLALVYEATPAKGSGLVLPNGMPAPPLPQVGVPRHRVLVRLEGSERPLLPGVQYLGTVMGDRGPAALWTYPVTE